MLQPSARVQNLGVYALARVFALRDVEIAKGVDIIDLKEPHLGPLSPVAPTVWRDVAAALATAPAASADHIKGASGFGQRLSAALGEGGGNDLQRDLGELIRN